MAVPITNNLTNELWTDIEATMNRLGVTIDTIDQDVIRNSPTLKVDISTWLLAKGLDQARIDMMSNYVFAKCVSVGDRYIAAIMRNDTERKDNFGSFDNIKPNRSFKDRTGRQGLDLKTPDEHLDDNIKKLLDEKPPITDDDYDDGVGLDLDFKPGPEPKAPQGQGPIPNTPEIQNLRTHGLDPEAIARSAARVIGPKLDEAVRTLRGEIRNESVNVENTLSKAVDRRWTEALQTFETKTKGLVDALKGDIFKYIDEQTPRKIQIIDNQGNILRELDSEPRHKCFDLGLKWLLSGQHLYIVGQAGTGKTHLFKQWGRALGKKIWLVGQALSKYDISGYKGPAGEYFGTVVRDALEQGGLLCIDEGDMWAAAALGFLNAPLANGWCAFPDRTIEVHPDFQCIIAANTFGRGATQQYIGRNPLDAASLDRFAYIEVGYDYDLELQIHGANPWTRYVQRVRDAVEQLKLQHVVSMRATARVHDGLRVGIDEEQVLFSALWRGLALDTINKIKSLAGDPPTKIIEVLLDDDDELEEVA